MLLSLLKFCFFGLLVGSVLVSRALAAPSPGAIKLSDDRLIEMDTYYCGLVEGSGWTPGELREGYFYSVQEELRLVEEQLSRSSESEREKLQLRKEALLLMMKRADHCTRAGEGRIKGSSAQNSGLPQLTPTPMEVAQGSCKASESTRSRSVRFRNCLLMVDGVTYISGPCKGSVDGCDDIYVEKKGYFVYFFAEHSGPARAYWNSVDKWSHAHAELGEMTKDGECWRSEKARFCAVE